MSGERVAVVVPVFERPTAVIEALESVSSQTRVPAALCVVDDGSGDGTPACVERWLEKASLPFPARLVRQPNRGVAAARNRGVAEAGPADFVAFLDSDDLWPADYLAEHLAVLSAVDGAVASTCDKIGPDAPRDSPSRVRRGWVSRSTTREIARRGPPGVSNSVVSADHFRAIGGFDERWRTAEDLDLMLRLSRRGRWLHVPDTVAVYRHRLGESRGEAGSLGHQHVDRRRTRAEVLQRFREAMKDEDPKLTRDLQSVVGRQWARAGRQLVAAGRLEEAAECFDRAIATRPADLRARWARLRLGQRRL